MRNTSSDWIVVPNTQERVLRNAVTGRLLEFSDDPTDTSMDQPILGIGELFSAEDMAALRTKATDYEIASGRAA